MTNDKKTSSTFVCGGWCCGKRKETVSADKLFIKSGQPQFWIMDRAYKKISIISRQQYMVPDVGHCIFWHSNNEAVYGSQDKQPL